MLDFLGVTENWSAIENIPWTQRWMFSDDATREPVSLDGVTFTGRVYIEGESESVELDIQKSSSAEEANVLIVSCIGLPEGRHPYEIFSISESGNQNRLISGYIGVIKSIGKLVDELKTYASRTLSIRLPGHVTRQIRLEWNSCTLASISAEHALNAAKQTHTDAETATKAATTATNAAGAASERAREAEGHAGSADASKVAAASSADAAAASANAAAKDAKTANDAREAVEGLAAAWPQTVRNGEQAIGAAQDAAVAVIRTKQSDAVLAVGRASQTAQQSVAGAQSAAVAAVQDVQQTAETSVGELVQQAAEASSDAEKAAERAGTSATAAQQALAAMPVDANGNITAQGCTFAGAVVCQEGISVHAGKKITLSNGGATIRANPNNNVVHVSGLASDTDVLANAVNCNRVAASALSITGAATFSNTINVNGGVNIPLTATPSVQTHAVNRVLAGGMAVVADACNPQVFLSSRTTYGSSVSVTEIVPGFLWRLRNSASESSSVNGTVRVDFDSTLVGHSNYGTMWGYVIPYRPASSKHKVTFTVGMYRESECVISTEQPIDTFTVSPKPSNKSSWLRIIDITFYKEMDTSTVPVGYPVRVREMVYDKSNDKWVVYTTMSVISAFNTQFNNTQAIVYQQNPDDTGCQAGLWLIVQGAAGQRTLRLADLHGVSDSFGWDTMSPVWWDAGYGSAHIGTPRVTQVYSPDRVNGAYHAFTAIESRQIQSTSSADFNCYE